MQLSKRPARSGLTDPTEGGDHLRLPGNVTCIITIPRTVMPHLCGRSFRAGVLRGSAVDEGADGETGLSQPENLLAYPSGRAQSRGRDEHDPHVLDGDGYLLPSRYQRCVDPDVVAQRRHLVLPNAGVREVEVLGANAISTASDGLSLAFHCMARHRPEHKYDGYLEHGCRLSSAPIIDPFLLPFLRFLAGSLSFPLLQYAHKPIRSPHYELTGDTQPRSGRSAQTEAIQSLCLVVI